MIKSFKHGINIKMDPNADFGTICRELEDKLRSSAKFFGDAHLVLSFEGKELTDDEEQYLLGLISECTDVVITCIVGRDEESDMNYVKAAEGFVENSEAMPGRFYKGTIKAGETLEVDSSLIILGDVNPGGNVRASGNIIVLGTIYGKVHAGCFGDNERFVAALGIKPTTISIGEYSEMLGVKSGILNRNKTVPTMVHAVNGRICADTVNATLFDPVKL